MILSREWEEEHDQSVCSCVEIEEEEDENEGFLFLHLRKTQTNGSIERANEWINELIDQIDNRDKIQFK